MTSFQSPTTLITVPTAAATATATNSSFFFRTPFIWLPKTHTKQSHYRFKVSCKVTPDDNEKKLVLPETQNLIMPKSSLDRREVLLGLGGVYSAVNLPAAFANPITTPEYGCKDSSMGIGDLKNAVRTRACCPPGSKNPIKDYVFPKDNNITRVRPAAHRLSNEYIKNYRDAIQAMRNLPDDDPHSFAAQAKIHCAYCNGAYTQEGKELQVHNSWLFFPFHRWYLYFFERIMRKYSRDPNLCLPYWNWDNPAGMTVPTFFEEKSITNDDPNATQPTKPNPIFDPYQDGNHTAGAIVDLSYNGTDSGASCLDQIRTNLSTMYRQMIYAADTLTFFGGVYRAGDEPAKIGDKSVGSIDGGCHTAVHRWVGDPRMPNNEDMGNFYSAGYDPLFYAHHSNVDRLWTIWNDLGTKLKGHKDPTDPDWCNASYLFYDENKELVRVYNKDCVNIKKLGYRFQPSAIPWINSRPDPRNTNSKIALNSAGKVKKAEDKTIYPLTLNQVQKVLVKRSKKNYDKEKEYEVLMIKGIKFNGSSFVKFDVYVNDEDDLGASSPFDSEFLGSFSALPHKPSDTMALDDTMISGSRFGLTELLEDIGSFEDEYILVTLAPKVGTVAISIAEIKIEVVPFEDIKGPNSC